MSEIQTLPLTGQPGGTVDTPPHTSMAPRDPQLHPIIEKIIPETGSILGGDDVAIIGKSFRP